MNNLLKIRNQKLSAFGGKIVWLIIFLGVIIVFSADATEFTSDDFKVSHPVLYSGLYSTSTGFQLFGTISQIAIGTSSVAGYDVASGFLYFPLVTSPVVSATAGDGKVDLTWSASVTAGGWSIGGYNVGRATIAGGPYTYSATLGNVTSSARTGLTNGTTYYFVVRAEDAFGKSIATSSEVSATPVAAAVTPPSTGGGGIPGSTATEVGHADVSGLAYPRGTLSFLLDGRVVMAGIADNTALFSQTLTNLRAGTYLLGILGQDEIGLRSPLVTFPLIIKAQKTTALPGIIVPPTLTTDRVEVRVGDLITLSGRSVPNSTILIFIEQGSFVELTEVRTTSAGAYTLPFDTSQLKEGRYQARARVVINNGQQSAPSIPALFTVGDKIILRERIDICDGRGAIPGDVNNDCRVNIVDFSIFAYWFDRQKGNTVPSRVDLTGDGIIDLADFSVAAYYWTG